MWAIIRYSEMLKVLQLIKKKPEVSIEDFERQVMESYAKTLKKVRGLRSFVMNAVRGVHEAEGKPVDYVAELVFTNEKAFSQALSDPEVKNVLEELERVSEEPRFIYLEESVLKKPKAAAKPKPKAKKAVKKKPAKKKARKAKKAKKAARKKTRRKK